MQLLGTSWLDNLTLHSVSLRAHSMLAWPLTSAVLLQIATKRPVVPAAAAEVLQLLGSSVFLRP